jgi:hypothetical protein
MPRQYVYDEESEGMVPIGENVDVGNQFLLEDELGPAPQRSVTLRDVSQQARPTRYRPNFTPRMENEVIRGGEEWIDEHGGRRTIRQPEYRQRQVGWDTEMIPEEEERPDTVYATNVPQTAETWRRQGKKPYFVDEMSNEISTPEGGKISGWTPPERQKELQKEKRIADARNKPPGPKPSQGQLSEMDEFNKFWGAHLAEHYDGEDPTKNNPTEVGEKARAEARKNHEQKLLFRDLYGKEKDVDYTAIEKEIEQVGKTAEEKAKWDRNTALREKQEAFNWFKVNKKSEAGEEKPKSRADVQGAQEYGRRMMEDPGSLELTQEEKEAIAGGEKIPLINRKLRSEKLVEINRVRALSGLSPLEEKMTKGPQKEYRDWGLFRTGEKEIPGQYEYPESQYQYGTARNGRRVKRDINGRVSYAD